MAETHGAYILCSNCKCKYHNANGNIEVDFGYTRLGERYKTCVKCRTRRKQWSQTDKGKEYEERHTEYKHQYWKEHKDEFMEKRSEKIKCQYCGEFVRKQHISRHVKSYCKNHNNNSTESG